MLKELGPGLLDIFAPNLQNKIMNTKLDNAICAIKDIKTKLAEYGLEVDYQRYFEDKLNVPLKAINALSEVDTNTQRELLKNLFLRHLAGQYKDDSRYVLFIRIIESMTPLDVKLLQYINEGGEIPPTTSEYERSVLKEKLSCEYEDVLMSEESLLSLGLIKIHQRIQVPQTQRKAEISYDRGFIGEDKKENTLTWGKVLGEQTAIQETAPKLTVLGCAFMEACTSL